MKKLLVAFMILGLTSLAYADHIFTVTVSDEDYKVLQWQLVTPDQWVIDAVTNKISVSKERMLLELTDKRPEKLTEQEKKNLIDNSTLKTRKEKENITMEE